MPKVYPNVTLGGVPYRLRAEELEPASGSTPAAYAIENVFTFSSDYTMEMAPGFTSKKYFGWAGFDGTNYRPIRVDTNGRLLFAEGNRFEFTNTGIGLNELSGQAGIHAHVKQRGWGGVVINEVNTAEDANAGPQGPTMRASPGAGVRWKIIDGELWLYQGSGHTATECILEVYSGTTRIWYGAPKIRTPIYLGKTGHLYGQPASVLSVKSSVPLAVIWNLQLETTT